MIILIIHIIVSYNQNISLILYVKDESHYGTNARKVISEVYTFFVLQCTVFGRKSKHKTDVTPDMESIFTKIIYERFWSKETIM